MEEILTIIIADDNTALTEMLANEINKHAKFKILGITDNTKEELQLIDSEKPQIVITDIMRTDNTSGLDAIRLYKDKEYSPKFLVVSAGTYYYTDQLKECNVKYYINKPFDISYITEILNHMYDEIYPKFIIKPECSQIHTRYKKSFSERLLQLINKKQLSGIKK